jgi:hypothetical protein
MRLKKFFKFAIFSLFFGLALQADQAVFEQYQPIIADFKALSKKNRTVQNAEMQSFFLKIAQPYSVFTKQLHQDIDKVRKEIKACKRLKKSYTDQEALYKNLSSLYKFIKKYRLQYQIALFHQDVRAQWNSLFQAVEHGKDVEPLLSVAGIEQTGIDGLKNLIKLVEKDLKQVETYEYRLHTDWIDAKLANYVLKIELVRLRNAAIFHPLSKRTKLKLSSTYPR